MLILLCNDIIFLIQLIKINFINLTNKLLFNLNFLSILFHKIYIFLKIFISIIIRFNDSLLI